MRYEARRRTNDEDWDVEDEPDFDRDELGADPEEDDDDDGCCEDEDA
jgi:hypothetical protein